MAIGKKIRVYDLAREVKQDTKRVMEDLRREGADISVPSNSVSAELADKIRQKYVPKAEAAPKRAIKVIKATKKAPESAEEVAEPQEEIAEVVATEPEPEPVAPVTEPPVEVEESPKSVRKVLVKKPKVIDEPEAQPLAAEPVAEEPAEVEAADSTAVPEGNGQAASEGVAAATKRNLP